MRLETGKKMRVTKEDKMKYERTTGGKHRWKRMYWSPVFRGGRAMLRSGAVYEVYRTGWRRVK